MKLALLLLLFLPLFSLAGEKPLPERFGQFDSAEAFVKTVTTENLVRKDSVLGPLFSFQSDARGSKKKTGDTISTCKVAWQREADAFVFATAGSGTKSKRDYVAVLFLLVKNDGKWTVADTKSFGSIKGKEPYVQRTSTDGCWLNVYGERGGYHINAGGKLGFVNID